MDGTLGARTRVILTNHDSEPFRAKAKRRGVTHFFDKSNEFDLFLDTLKALSVESETA